MKTSLEIANQLGINVFNVRNTINKNGIRGTYNKNTKKMYYDQYQEELIIYLLYFKYTPEYIIYQSKINNKNFEL